MGLKPKFLSKCHFEGLQFVCDFTPLSTEMNKNSYGKASAIDNSSNIRNSVLLQ